MILRTLKYFVLIIMAQAIPAFCAANNPTVDRLILTIEPVPANGLVVAQVDLSAAKYCNMPVKPDRLRLFDLQDNQPVPSQFVPDFDNEYKGTIVLRCATNRAKLSFYIDFYGNAESNLINTNIIRTRWYTVIYNAQRSGGLPSAIEFNESGWKFDGLRWNDRLYHRQRGSFLARNDRNAKIECISKGAVCTVIRTQMDYQADGKKPYSQPHAVYDWYYFNDFPFVLVRAIVVQNNPTLWHEAHFLEMGFATNYFSKFGGGEPPYENSFKGLNKSYSFNKYGYVVEGRNIIIGMFNSGSILVYDGVDYERYLHSHTDKAWQEWNTQKFERSTWLWISNTDKPAEAIAAIAAEFKDKPVASITVEKVKQQIDLLESQLAKTPPDKQQKIGWQLALTRFLETRGLFKEALEADANLLPGNWNIINAGELRLILDKKANGLSVANIADTKTGRLLGVSGGFTIFEIELRNSPTGEVIRLNSDCGWNNIQLKSIRPNEYFVIWKNPQNQKIGALEVTAQIYADRTANSVRWDLTARGQSKPWSIWSVRFPQVCLSVQSKESQLLLPQAAGVLKPIGRENISRYYGNYPSGWLSMQLCALYDKAVGTGFYLGMHDPLGSTKDFTAESIDTGKSVRLFWEIPPPYMGKPANSFELPGKAVWQLQRGDWFDSALIYKKWARTEAKWFPHLSKDGRTDTPLWMRELSVWALSGGAHQEVVPKVLDFAKALGIPVGFHWYSWHQIPFDNDYPHYFPVKDGFAQGVKQLQDNSVFVMPYINGRLWDTRDRGTTDFEFTKIALPAATKKYTGEPYIETYGSKETNGEPVRLAVMCPATRLWQQRQYEIVMRLFKEYAVKAVYIDQVAAAHTVLCFDSTHNHPEGGGSWWNELGYWKMLDLIRRDKPSDRMLTTECNAEPFIRWFDGYLTWHWQYDGQVPLFPSVYSGAIQMFGRAYRGGPTKDLALRMKAAQQLVFGEQLGWIDPGVLQVKDNFEFFKNASLLRWNFRKYFYAGEMARPPELLGDIPTVTADWQWSGVWLVTTPALMSGAFYIPSEKRILMLFANVHDKPLTAEIRYNLQEYGFKSGTFTRRKWMPQGIIEQDKIGAQIHQTVTFPPSTVWAWEIIQK